MELLKKLYPIMSRFEHETEMKDFVVNHIKEHSSNVLFEVDPKGNLYVTKGKAKDYPCLLADLDEMDGHCFPDYKIYWEEETVHAELIGIDMSKDFGAESKNGIWIILKCMQEFDALKAVFFVENCREIVGSKEVDVTFFDDCRFVLQLNLEGSSDFNVYEFVSGVSPYLSSKEFEKDIPFEEFGFKRADYVSAPSALLQLYRKGLTVAAANISCGYQESKTVIKDLQNSLEFVKAIIRRCTKTYKTEGAFYAENYDIEIYDPEDLYTIKYDNHVTLIEMTGSLDYDIEFVPGKDL